jgi:uncharacterized membrane protein
MPATVSESFLHKMRPIHRVLVGVVAASIVHAFTYKIKMEPLLRFMLLWDVFALVYIGFAWMVFFTHNTDQIRRKATAEDGSRFFVFVIVTLAAFASMFTVLLLMLSQESKGSETIYLPVAIAGMLLSWVLVHTTFVFHYAHLYYDDNPDDAKRPVGGLDFPGPQKPDYIDFAYFSFVVGMTFQVSDVEITRRHIRRVCLLHGLLSFCLNTFVVALTINLVAGLRH